MGIILPEDELKPCVFCKRIPKEENAVFYGKAMWHLMWPTCRHPKFVVCNRCYSREIEIVCGVCGREEFYT